MSIPVIEFGGRKAKLRIGPGKRRGTVKVDGRTTLSKGEWEDLQTHINWMFEKLAEVPPALEQGDATPPKPKVRRLRRKKMAPVEEAAPAAVPA